MNLPSFLWLWRIAAWSMGLAVVAYLCLAATGLWMRWGRLGQHSRPGWLRVLHLGIGSAMIGLVLVLLAIGLVGTLGYYGTLGHSVHLPAGLLVVGLTLLSGWSALQIGRREWARSLHIGLNLTLFFGFLVVSLSGWSVVQKYLP